MNAYLIEGHKYRTHINEISPRLEWIGGLDDKAAKLEVFVEPVWTSADRARALRIRNKYAHEFRSISPTGDVTFSKSVGRRKHRERTEPFLSLLVDWKDALNITSQLQICMTVSWICPTCKQNVPNATPCDGCSDHYTVPTNTPATIHMRFQNARMTSIPPNYKKCELTAGGWEHLMRTGKPPPPSELHIEIPSPGQTFRDRLPWYIQNP